MRRVVGVRTRILVAGGLSAALGVGVTIAVVRSPTKALVLDSARTTLPRMMARGILQDCQANPAAFTYVGPGIATTWAYGADLSPVNPAAPALDAVDKELARKIAVGQVDTHLHGITGGGVVVARIADQGPCQVLGASFPAPRAIAALFRVAALAASILTGVGALLTWFLAVRPLVRRVHALRLSASLVGSESGYTSPAAEGDVAGADDLDELGRELDRAHRRIRRDAAILEEKRHDLRRHVENIAHDLKTPMSSLQLLLEQAAAAVVPGAPLSDVVTGAIRDVVYLGGLVSNLRLAAVLEGGFTPRTQPHCPLVAIVDRATSRVSLLARRRGVELAVALPDEPVLVDTDPLAAEQAITNVVENAVVHGATGGHVSVLVSTRGSAFEIRVMDDGPGVVDSDLPRLGERTFRADAARRRDGRGQGLGLAITREVCRHFGWTLAFSKLTPQGLSVSIRGPRSRT